jgi:hypothetical protein
MPIHHGEAQMIAHALACDDFVRVVVLEREWVFGLRSFVTDSGDVRKCCWHGCVMSLVLFPQPQLHRRRGAPELR